VQIIALLEFQPLLVSYRANLNVIQQSQLIVDQEGTMTKAADAMSKKLPPTPTNKGVTGRAEVNALFKEIVDQIDRLPDA
jgi:hypothetical protein